MYALHFREKIRSLLILFKFESDLIFFAKPRFGQQSEGHVGKKCPETARMGFVYRVCEINPGMGSISF